MNDSSTQPLLLRPGEAARPAGPGSMEAQVWRGSRRVTPSLREPHTFTDTDAARIGRSGAAAAS